MIAAFRVSSTAASKAAGVSQHLGHVLKPESRALHRRRHQQLPALRAEAAEPILREVADALRQPGRRQRRAPARDLNALLFAQAFDQLGQEPGVPRSLRGQVFQSPVGRGAECPGKHGHDAVVVQRPEGYPDSAVLLQQAEQVAGGALRLG